MGCFISSQNRCGQKNNRYSYLNSTPSLGALNFSYKSRPNIQWLFGQLLREIGPLFSLNHCYHRLIWHPKQINFTKNMPTLSAYFYLALPLIIRGKIVLFDAKRLVFVSSLPFCIQLRSKGKRSHNFWFRMLLLPLVVKIIIHKEINLHQ